jgi:monothiol glutaredoxin
MSARPLLDDAHLTPAARAKMAHRHTDVLEKVTQALAAHDVVVVGMAWNPHVGNARKALTEAGIEHTYLEFGNYLGQWPQRLTIKMWSGWPTFPQVFVKGTLIGGNTETRAAIADGSLRSLLG